MKLSEKRKTELKEEVTKLAKSIYKEHYTKGPNFIEVIMNDNSFDLHSSGFLCKLEKLHIDTNNSDLIELVKNTRLKYMELIYENNKHLLSNMFGCETSREVVFLDVIEDKMHAKFHF